jgi:hypothetical protein
MAELFNFGSVEEKVSVGGGNSQKYIYPGIRHNVVIKDVKEGKSQNKETPFIEFSLYSKEGGPETARTFQFYTSPNTIVKTMEKIKHIATKVVKEEELNKATDVEALRDLLKGKSLRMKFTGEEYKNQNGEVKSRALIGLPPFAESISDEAEYPAISDEETKLKFDDKNQYDFKKLAEEGSEEPQTEQAGKSAW